MTMETEVCDGCGLQAEKGTLIRDSVDASQLRCEKCIVPDKKARKPRKRKETPVIAAPAVIIETFTTPYPQEPEADALSMRLDAEAWARESGLGKVIVRGPDREDFPRHGFGYVFQILEDGGKERRASARYTSAGRRNMWTLDGMVTG
jgi:hypothetical protein